jgi:hypothetical protein
VHLASNPCRLHFCGQQLVFYREDLMHKMRRSTACLQPLPQPRLALFAWMWSVTPVLEGREGKGDSVAAMPAVAVAVAVSGVAGQAI